MERALCEENYHLYGVEEVERNYIKNKWWFCLQQNGTKEGAAFWETEMRKGVAGLKGKQMARQGVQTEASYSDCWRLLLESGRKREDDKWVRNWAELKRVWETDFWKKRLRLKKDERIRRLEVSWRIIEGEIMEKKRKDYLHDVTTSIIIREGDMRSYLKC